MRLTLINQFYVPDLSPTAHLCASLAEHRAAMGDGVTVIAGRGGYVAPVAAANEAGGVRVHRIWTAQLGSRTPLRRFLDWLTFYVGAMISSAMLPRQDVFIAMTTPPYIAWAGVLQKLIHPRTRLVLWNMDCWPDTVERLNMIRPGGLLSRAMRAMNRALFRRLDHLICLDGAMADLLLSQYSPTRRNLPCTIIPNWERAELFPPTPTHDRERGDDSPGQSHSRFTVLYLGNAGYGHEFETMLDAAERLRDIPMVFLLVGGGSRRRWIAQERERRGLRNVIFQDYVSKEQTPAIMRAADCALITLEDHALGVMSPSKLHANLAMGLPIIYVGPAASNVDEAIERFGCGISLHQGGGERMARFIRDLMNDPSRRANLSRQARRAFDEAYCDLQTLPRFDAVLEQLFDEDCRRR